MAGRATKRLRWLIAIGLGLAGLCFVTWQWSEQPPYRFMAGCKLWFIEPTPFQTGATTYVVIYRVTTPLEPLVVAARQETGRKLEEKTIPVGGVPITYYFDLTTSIPDLTILSWDKRMMGMLFPVASYPPIPDGTTGVISIVREPTPLDRLRAWLYGLRWKGARP